MNIFYDPWFIKNGAYMHFNVLVIVSMKENPGRIIKFFRIGKFGRMKVFLPNNRRSNNSVIE